MKNEWLSVHIVPQFEAQPRGGRLGKFIDLFFPRYKENEVWGFVVATTDGGIVTSPDGEVWTWHTLPASLN